MATVAEFGAKLDVPLEVLVKMAENQILDPRSVIYQAFEAKCAAKMAADRALAAKQGGKPGKTRVYIQHAVPADGRYKLVQCYPQFDIRFSTTDMRAGAVYIANAIMIAEYMFTQFKVHSGSVIAYGVSIKQMLMRNRDWVHVCVPGHIASVQADYYREDRAVAAMVNSLRRNGHDPGLATRYINEETRIHCTDPQTCKVVAERGVMVLGQVDTNFRQIAYFMRVKRMRLLFFAIPCNKHMELCTEGKFDELDAYVIPSEDGTRIGISYKNAPGFDMTYTYANYLELIARTSVVLGKTTYHKEFFNRVNGFVVYKVTAIDQIFDDRFEPYKSWVEPMYAKKYMVYAPVLKPLGNVSTTSDWVMSTCIVDREVIDQVVEYAMRVNGAEDIASEIKRRLFTKTSSFILDGQVLNSTFEDSVEVFDMICLAIYVHVFIRKYNDGIAVNALAPHARMIANLSRGAPIDLWMMYVGTIFGNALRSVNRITAKVRELYYQSIIEDGAPLPSFAVCPGFVEYSDTASSNPRFNGWVYEGGDPSVGFSTMLPRVDPRSYKLPTPAQSVVTATSVNPSTVAELCATGECFIDGGKIVATRDKSVVELACGLFESITQVFDDAADLPELVDVTPTKTAPMVVPNTYGETVPPQDLVTVQVPQKVLHTSTSVNVHELVSRITRDHHGLIDRSFGTYMEDTAVFSGNIPDIVKGPVAGNAMLYFVSALNDIFPGSLAMTTQNFESDKLYSNWDMVAKAIRMKIDISKLDALRPEQVYLPLIRSHVQPSVKSTTINVLHAVIKRNANTPADADMLDEDFMWERSWQALKRVFYIPGCDEKLRSWPYIGPSEEAVNAWVTKLDEQKRNKLSNNDTGFTLWDLIDGASANHMILKAKLKPSLDNSYATDVKQPQSIQYDPTGKTVAVLSPIISQKVQREAELLRPNVLILQYKSVEAILSFVNRFDWRDNGKGKRRYIEIDYAKYDKSQPAMLARFYLRKMAEYGVLPEFLAFIKRYQYSRTVSHMKAGVKAWLEDQNLSGASFTLDRNNDINMCVVAEFLLEIVDCIEFIILMGDDILIAIRGKVDISNWESEINRKYNLTLKAEIRDCGYICSMHVAHIPGGGTILVPDIIKRTLALTDQSVTDRAVLHEQYVSYCDVMKYVADVRAQRYLAHAIVEREKHILTGITVDAVLCLFKGHAKLLESEEEFLNFKSPVKITRFY